MTENTDIAFQNHASVIDMIRGALKKHSKVIRISFVYGQDILQQLPAMTDKWVKAAQEETEQPDEGDYLAFQNGGYETHCSYEMQDGGYSYTVEIIPNYYMYYAQEELVTQKTAEILKQLQITDGMKDIEKIKRIYDYICQHVSYDRVHKKNRYYCLRSTAYAALVQKTATCQGYSVALYRLLREAGINVRIITGSASDDDLHAWNIVEADGRYYNVDATWDSCESEGYRYFMKGGEAFADHRPDPKYQTDDFLDSYPVSETDYNEIFN